MTKLTRLEVENYKRLVAIDIQLGNQVTEISGRNGAGKSSTIDAVSVLLQGAAVAPAVPIRRGADECTIRGTLGDLIAERKFRNGADGKTVSTITLRTPEGARYPSPQKHLDDLIGKHMLDPLDFINMDSRKQFNVLRQFVPNVDFEAIDKANIADYDRRTDVNRLAKEAHGAASMIAVPDDTPEQEIVESDLVDELQKAGEHNAQIEARKSRRDQHAQTIRHHIESVKRLGSEIADMEDALADMRERQQNIQTTADTMQKQLDEAEPLPAPIDVTEIRAKLDAAKLINANVAKRCEKAKHLALAKNREEESEAITARMTKREQDKQAAIAQAKLPVPGVGFGNGFITLNDVPFSQASTAEKLRTAFALIVALNPKLRLAWIRDASLLDDDSLRIVDDLSREYDCQVLLETVRPTGRNAIVLEAGQVKAAAQEDAA